MLVSSVFFVKIGIPKLKEVLKRNVGNQGIQPEMVELEIQGPIVGVEPELRDILQEFSKGKERSEHYKTYHQKPDFKEQISGLMGRLQNMSNRESLKAVSKTFYEVSLLSEKFLLKKFC